MKNILGSLKNKIKYWEIKKIDYGYRYEKNGVLINGYQEVGVTDALVESLIKQNSFEFEILEDSEEYTLLYSEKKAYTLEIFKRLFGTVAIYYSPLVKRTTLATEKDKEIINKNFKKIVDLLEIDTWKRWSKRLEASIKIKMDLKETRDFVLYLGNKTPKNEKWSNAEVWEHYNAFKEK